MKRPEQEIHKVVYQHLRQRGAPGIFAWHTPNGGYRRPIEAAIMKSLGVVAGLPDLCILKAGQLFCLELKADEGRVTPKQFDTMKAMAASGAIVGVAHGLNAALKWLEDNQLLKGQSK